MAHSGIEVLFEGQNFARLIGGLETTIAIAFVALICGLALGLILGVLRTLKNRVLRLVLRLYLEFFRIVPTVVLLFLFYYILPKTAGVNLPANEVATLVFALWTAAEMSDIVRGALISVPKHQLESGLAIGLNRWQLYRYILIPQAVSLEIPATINLMTRVIKTTSLLLLISVADVINVSGGQKQRIAIIRALALKPELMLFDEVTASLDPEMVRGVLNIISRLAKQDKMTMIVVTHEMNFAKQIADRVLFLENGELLETTAGTQFFENPQTDRAKEFLESMDF